MCINYCTCSHYQIIIAAVFNSTLSCPNKCIDVYLIQLPGSGSGFLFLSDSKLLPAFFSDLPLLIFPTLLADKRPNWKSAQGPQPLNMQLFNPCPFYYFTLILTHPLCFTLIQVLLCHLALKKIYWYITVKE